MDIAECKLAGNADAVEFCPASPYHNILAAATYTLQEGDQQSRRGSISLFDASSDVGLKLLHVVDTEGVFDMKWNANYERPNPLLAQASSDGCLVLYSLESKSELENCEVALNMISTEKVSSSMCLCLDWDPSATSIVVGLSDGSISVVTREESQLCSSQSWEGHEYEVWYTLFDCHRPKIVYSGSDDCRFCCWDLRSGSSNLVFKNTKSHKMGVCSIAQSPLKPDVVLTGSYDEFLRAWDVRAMSRPLNEISINLGGGVWRIKHHPEDPNLVLAACMHNGFAILKVVDDNFTVVENYTKHESLAYGADWQRGKVGKRGPLIATCSFYDKLLRLWLPESLLTK